jgi:hypothetical protein
MSDELISSQPVATQIVSTQVEAGKKGVDESPVVSPEIQAEIDRLAKVKADHEKAAKEAEEKAIYWRKEKAAARADYFRRGERVEEPPPEKKEEITVGTPPKREDFEDYDAYVDALVDYRTEVKLAKWQKSEAEKQGKTEYQQKIEGLLTKIDEGYKKYPDFEEVAKDPTVPITPLIRDILAEVDHPEDVAYYLGKNRAEAIKISRMTPFAAHKEILKIEAEVAKASPSPSTTKVTNAPSPIKPLGSGDSLPNKDISKMTQKEYEEWRKSQGARNF